jgi:hypothetical protein
MIFTTSQTSIATGPYYKLTSWVDMIARTGVAQLAIPVLIIDSITASCRSAVKYWDHVALIIPPSIATGSIPSYLGWLVLWHLGVTMADLLHGVAQTDAPLNDAHIRWSAGINTPVSLLACRHQTLKGRLHLALQGRYDRRLGQSRECLPSMLITAQVSPSNPRSEWW